MTFPILLLLIQLPILGQMQSWQAGIVKVTTAPDPVLKRDSTTGTGFVVALRGDNAYIVTSAHVIEGDPNPQIEFVAVSEQVYRATVRHREAAERTEGRALALVVVSNPPEGVRVLQEAGSISVLGDRVTVAGFPEGAFTAVDTTIARLEGRDVVLSRETEVGFSGGPVLRDGAVTGLVYGRSSGLGLALGSSSLRAYLDGFQFSWERGSDVAAEIRQDPELRPGEIRYNPADNQQYVWIPRGEFQMGCSPGDSNCEDDERPLHTVRITRGFWLGQTEVTQVAYLNLMGETPSAFRGPNNPVDTVAWDDARRFCEAAGGRLPTEAEWEYAARAGSQAMYGAILDEIAWYQFNSDRQTHPVGQKKPNYWGLYDMLGNVGEWVMDWYQWDYYGSLLAPAVDPKGPSIGEERVFRGGSWYLVPRAVRVSDRWRGFLETRGNLIGFRCARN